MNKQFQEALQCTPSTGGMTGQTMPSTASIKSVDTIRSVAIIRELWPEFTAEVERRLEAGARAYGDASFDKPAHELIDEIEQELDDVMGWGFIEWVRLRRLRAILMTLE